MVRRAFTLLEVLMATAILAAVMVAVLQSTTSAFQYASLGSAQDDLAREGRECLRQIAADVSLAGWYLPKDQVPVVTAFPTTMAADRAAIYYPYVFAQTQSLPAGLAHLQRGSSLQQLTGLPIDLPPYVGVPSDWSRNWTEGFTDLREGDGRSYSRAYFAPSQELVFIRSQQSTTVGDAGFVTFSKDDPQAWNLLPTTPTGAGNAPRNVLGILAMSQWRKAQNELPGASVRADAAGTWYRFAPYQSNGQAHVRRMDDIILPSSWLELKNLMPTMRWESIDPLVTDSTAAGYNMTGGNVVDSSPGIAQPLLREFTYAVLPGDPALGYGRLVRAYKVASPAAVVTNPRQVTVGSIISAGAGYGMMVDRILSNHVVRVTFDTYRTLNAADPAKLELNQVRIRIFLLAEFGTGQRNHVFRMLEQTVTMRGRSGSTEYKADNTAIGTTTAGSTYYFPR